MKTETYVNWPGLLIILTISLVFGLIAIVSPITILRIFYRWPQYIYPKLFDPQKTLSSKKQNWQLLKENPEKYADKYRIQLISIRLIGLVALFIVVIGLLGAGAYFLGN